MSEIIKSNVMFGKWRVKNSNRQYWKGAFLESNTWKGGLIEERNLMLEDEVKKGVVKIEIYEVSDN